MRILFGLLAVVAISLAGGRSDAQTAASEIQDYRNVTVTFSENADECNLSDEEIFKQTMREKLAGAGFQQSEVSRVDVNLAVSANGFGLFNTNCVFSTRLELLVKVNADTIKTSDPAAQRAIERIGAVDVVIYSNALIATQQQKQPFDGGDSIAVRDRVLEMIGSSVNKLVADRAS